MKGILRQNNFTHKFRYFFATVLLGGCLILMPVLATASREVGAQIVSISRNFLGTRYQLQPLGEGIDGKFNQAPLMRFDRFDCQSYVETVLALAIASQTQQEFLPILLKLRYKNGQAGFLQRNHFPIADWMANNTANSCIENITQKIAHKNQLKYLSLMIDKPNWYQHLSQTRLYLPQATAVQRQNALVVLHALSQQVKPEKINVFYIPTSILAQVIPHIPQGAVIFIVHRFSSAVIQRIGTNMAVSHMGFAIWQRNILWLRAASSLYGKVVDMPLLPYLQNQPRAEGVIVLQAKNCGFVR